LICLYGSDDDHRPLPMFCGQKCSVPLSTGSARSLRRIAQLQARTDRSILRVITASSSFYRTFKVNPGDTEGHLLYELGNGKWDIPKLRSLLGKILPKHGTTAAGEITDGRSRPCPSFTPLLQKETPNRLKETRLKNLAKEALWAVLVAA
jgi:hypothetical protein